MALGLASVFASSAIAMASPVSHASARALVTQGTVTALTPSTGTPTSVTIQPGNLAQPTQNILLTSSTVYQKAGVTVTASSLSIGEPVRIVLTGRPASAALVQILAPRPFVIDGTVTALTPSTGTPTSVTVQPHNASTATITVALASSTVFYLGGASSTVASLMAGSHVLINASGTPPTATSVYVTAPRPVTIFGIVTALTPSTGTPTSVTVQPRNDKSAVITVTIGAGTLFFLGGASSTGASLMVGSQVQINASGTPATATTVYIAVPRPVIISGTVTSLTPSTGTPTSLTVLPNERHGVAVTIALGANTIYHQAGSIVSVSSLLVGSKVQVVVQGTPATATTVYIAVPRPIEVSGVVTALAPASGTPTSLTVQPEGFSQTPVSVNLGTGTKFFQSGASTTVAALLVGSHVQLSASGDPLTATVVHIALPVPNVTFGSVTGVTSASVTVQPRATGSAPITFTLNSTTMYFSGRRVSTIAAVNVGDVVRVAAASAAPTTALDVTVVNMVVVGRVTSVVGNQVSVTGFYGAAFTVNVTATTTYLRDGRTSSLSTIRSGDLISAIGPAMSGVTRSLTASTVWIGTKHNDIFHDAVIQHRDHDRRHHD